MCVRVSFELDIFLLGSVEQGVVHEKDVLVGNNLFTDCCHTTLNRLAA